MSSPEVVRDDGSRSNLMLVASHEDLPTLPVPNLDRNDNKFLSSSGVDDEVAAAIANASFIIPELKGPDVEDVLGGMEESGPVHVSTPSLPGKMLPPRRLNFSGVEVPPTPFNSFDCERSDADLEDAIMTEAANLEMENKLKLALAAAAKAVETPKAVETSVMTSPSCSGGAVAAKKRAFCSANRKDVCKGMSVEEVERVCEDKRVTEYKPPNSVYEKEVRRRDKIATCLSMLRQVVPGITPETDNTAVFEMTAKYVTFLKDKVGDKEQDKLFLKERMTL